MDIPNRDELEAELARRFSKLSSKHRRELLQLLGTPPDYGNVPGSFWERVAGELNGSFVPFLSDVFLDSAERLMAGIPIGVDWGLVNTEAARWAREYSFRLINDIVDVSRRATQEAVAGYFEQGMTIGDLQNRLARVFGATRAEVIAVTEVTRAASEGEQRIAIELHKMGVDMTPIWHTNNDDLVCPICEPLNDKEMTGEYENVFPPAHPRCRCWIMKR